MRKLRTRMREDEREERGWEMRIDDERCGER